MFATRNFVACIEQQLVERGFGAIRKAEILDNFDGLAKRYQAQGYGEQVSQAMAMNRVFDDLATITRERAKGAAKAIEVQATIVDAVRRGLDPNITVSRLIDAGGGPGTALVRGAMALLVTDPRFKGVISVEAIKDSYRQKYHFMLRDASEKYGKGAFGRQKNSAGLDNVVRELEGINTGDADAAAFAKNYVELQRVMVADRNNVGGTMQWLEGFNVPQRQNPARVMKAGWEVWRDKHMAWLDWDKTTRPNGAPIAPEDRESVLRSVYDTLQTDGKSDIDIKKPSAGRGGGIGNSLEDHRFMHYKQGSWFEMHRDFGDGSIYDVITRHIESMAHNTAMVQQFGRNPQLALKNIESVIRKFAGDLEMKADGTAAEKKAGSEAERVIRTRLRTTFDIVSHANPVDPNSPLANGLSGTAAIITSAKLAGTTLIATVSDFGLTLSTRMEQHRSFTDGIAAMFSSKGGIGTYTSGVTFGHQKQKVMSAQAGYVFDSAVGATFTTERFSPVVTYGNAVTRNISDFMMRISGLNRHTEIARWTNQMHFMGMMWNDIDKGFDALPYKHVLERYGIDAASWNEVRAKMIAFEPEPDAKFFRPIDILQLDVRNKSDLYQRFFSMINEEAKFGVPGATSEARATLSLSTRPESMAGALLHSFSMYKNFPVTFAQMYGRMALAQEGAQSRIGYISAVIATATLAGAVGVQLREVLTKGRTPLPMFVEGTNIPSPKFWGKAFMAGGGASIYGDFLFGSVNEYGRNLADTLAGPLAGFASDTTDLILGAPFKWVSLWDRDDTKDFKAETFQSRGAKFLKSYTPGTSLWYTRQIVDREIWDRLEEMADPNGYQSKRDRARRKQEKEYGNTYYNAPGQRILTGR